MDPFKEFEQRRFRIAIIQWTGGGETWGTGAGVAAFQRLDSSLSEVASGTLVTLDFGGISRTDVSFQREAIVETIRKHRPRLLFLASNIQNDDVLANIQAALEARGERLLIREDAPTPQVVGRPLSDAHLRTFQAVEEHPGFTSSQMTVPPYGLESSTASARLTALWRAGLVARVTGAAASGGKEYRYFPIGQEMSG